MIRREYEESIESNIVIGCITATSRYIVDSQEVAEYIAKGANKVGLFIVGGGGAGSGDFSKAGHAGGGGNGGVVNALWDIPLVIQPIDITIGLGGVGGTRNRTANAGTLSQVSYGGILYTAAGGRGGYNSNGGTSVTDNRIIKNFPRVEGSAYCGQGGGWKEPVNIKKYYNTKFDTSLIPPAWSVKGEEGSRNPFDETDTNIYGSAGGAGYNVHSSYDLSSTNPNFGGTGAGRGGYGSNNATTNRGTDATFYGCGGGGGAFSSSHVYSLGGNGYQGIVKIYFLKHLY